MSARRSLRIGFLHPDLGIGGAERFVVDAARLLGSAGHRVTVLTTHHDPARAFEETRDGSIDVRVCGGFLPTAVGGRLRAPCAIARMAYLAGAVALRGPSFDVIVCDLVAHALPLLKRVTGAKLVFYCHFPDLLLAPRRHGLYAFYRAPIDRLEAVGTGCADRVLVNSQFTADVFRRTFPRLRATPLEVVYPGVDCARYAEHDATRGGAGDAGEILLLSVSRFERGKNVGLAIEALALVRERLGADTFARVRLVLAGGFDERLREDRETLASLQALARDQHLDAHVTFRPSCTEAERLAMLGRCRCVVYTPTDEHFGFVPLEAMAATRPVVASDSGGPRETIQHGLTGFLCQPTPRAFADALISLISDPDAAARMGQAGRRHVATNFSLAAFGARLDAIVRDLVEPRAASR